LGVRSDSAIVVLLLICAFLAFGLQLQQELARPASVEPGTALQGILVIILGYGFLRYIPAKINERIARLEKSLLGALIEKDYSDFQKKLRDLLTK
jgi:hypothetical protein